MSKWLENARMVAVPKVKSAKTLETVSFGTNGTIGTRPEDRNQEDATTAFEERAAICEYDGGLPHSHAELIALSCVAPLGPGETLESRDATAINLAAYLDKLRAARRTK